jgi:hypothetical protein
MYNNHWETSYLKPLESAPKHNPHLKSKQFSQLNLSDIDGAQAKPRHPIEVSRDNYTLSTSDIDGGVPQRLIPNQVNKPNDRHLKNDDIKDSQPYRNRMVTNRVLNPLNPDYQLSQVTIRPLTPPKNTKDTMRVTDINNDPDYPSKKLPSRTRDHINYHDAVGNYTSQPKLRPRNTQVPTPLDVQDINGDGIFKTARSTNPLSPRYHYDRPPSGTIIQQRKQEENKLWSIGNIPDSHPRKLPSLRNDRPLFSLKTEDIEFMKRSNIHHVPSTFPVNRRDYREINSLDDIGPQVRPSNKFTTFAKVSSRSTNPLNPIYKF